MLVRNNTFRGHHAADDHAIMIPCCLLVGSLGRSHPMIGDMIVISNEM